MLIVGCSGSGQRNALLNLVIHQSDIDKIYLFAKHLHKTKYQLPINPSSPGHFWSCVAPKRGGHCGPPPHFLNSGRVEP